MEPRGIEISMARSKRQSRVLAGLLVKLRDGLACTNTHNRPYRLAPEGIRSVSRFMRQGRRQPVSYSAVKMPFACQRGEGSS
jgi:hypothetical protein